MDRFSELPTEMKIWLRNWKSVWLRKENDFWFVLTGPRKLDDSRLNRNIQPFLSVLTGQQKTLLQISAVQMIFPEFYQLLKQARRHFHQGVYFGLRVHILWPNLTLEVLSVAFQSVCTLGTAFIRETFNNTIIIKSLNLPPAESRYLKLAASKKFESRAGGMKTEQNRVVSLCYKNVRDLTILFETSSRSLLDTKLWIYGSNLHNSTLKIFCFEVKLYGYAY